MATKAFDPKHPCFVCGHVSGIHQRSNLIRRVWLNATTLQDIKGVCCNCMFCAANQREYAIEIGDTADPDVQN